MRPGVLAALLGSLAVLARVVSAQPPDKPEPLWAYGYLGPPTPADYRPQPAETVLAPRVRAPDPTQDLAAQLAPRQVSGSAALYSEVDVRYGGAVVDWFPGDHPPMPTVVAHGPRRLGSAALACGFCHLPTGRGRPENAPIAGQDPSYFLRQLDEFRRGARHSSDPRKPNTAVMIALAKAMSREEEQAAAAYFGAMKWTPWIRVVETDVAPKTQLDGNLFIAIAPTRTEPITGRIVEVPEDPVQAANRNPRSGFVAYVPVGSLQRGEELVKTGSPRMGSGPAAQPKTIACATCHGPDLAGLKDSPGIAGRSPSYLARQLYDFQRGARHGAFAPLMQPVVANLGGDDLVAITAYVASLGAPSPTGRGAVAASRPNSAGP